MTAKVDSKYVPRLKNKYDREIIPALMKKFNYKNIMEVPRLEKIVVHVTLGEAIQNIKLLDAAEKQLALITGQKPLVTKAKRALAAFKLKKGMPLGCKVTLRKERMYEFLDKLISLALPRIRDFRGISPKSFDGRGNYSFGIKEQFIFPEIDYDKVEMIHGLDITICTTAKTDEEALALLKEFGMPYRK
ncbi:MULTISPECIES: 50S ribosomal protein L5 [Thermodesulfovibrio]|jgi:large subunit ribosomal protein L5|uniref:Large ribosomal subunit protein uL5 n=2 Tax=Thermodesulfovibrio yellowstonii TaxID=28262 RepID=B5YG35_THEYD|nr:50S ribosomal protein L5 [Thermodesulfovibrio yellowstonii DSM 11347]GLI53176.1 50S ribosomal protein L5 [Thermodesulfovibrio islandicus]